MPRTSGVSSRTRLLFTQRRPRPTTVARWSDLVPATLLTSVTFTVLPAAPLLPDLVLPAAVVTFLPSAQNFFHRLAALGGNFGRSAQLRERLERRPHHVVGVRGSMRLGHDVVDAHHVENCPHRTAGDDARTVC